MAPSADLLQADNRMAKRRRALLESNPPRNSRPETHRNDGRGGGGGGGGGLPPSCFWVLKPWAADSILDRLVHAAHRLELRGDSLRKNPPKAPEPGKS